MARLSVFMCFALLFGIICLSVPVCARAPGPLHPGHAGFEGFTDIGDCRIPGTLDYSADNQVYTIGGSGRNIWDETDHFSFAWKKISGDFILTAEFRFQGEGTHAHRKTGWMVRKSLDPGSPYADAVIHGDGLASLQFRRAFKGDTREMASPLEAPDVVQLERRDNTFIMRAARAGEPLSEAGSIELELGEPVYAGLAVCSHDDDSFEKVLVSNLRIEIPEPAAASQEQASSGSRLEILDIETGLRKIVLETDRIIEAPNWTSDGRALIYNSMGLLFRFDLETGISTPIDTGSARGINNDHLISPDGRMLGISHRAESETMSGSTISLLPIGGGEPVMITDKAPSYLHGWSPDDQYLVYTARRDGQYDIYRIGVRGGKEIQLTDHPRLDDGPEYSPDGEWIYFNSARTGIMQIWRMKSDGTGLEQLTFDQWNDWFPHISPDGKTVVFLSYPPETGAEDHPRHKRVMLRTMDPEGGKIRVAAYLHGGQGTINVPSWSPDSKKAAFVSYSFQARDAVTRKSAPGP